MFSPEIIEIAKQKIEEAIQKGSPTNMLPISVGNATLYASHDPEAVVAAHTLEVSGRTFFIGFRPQDVRGAK